MPNFISKLLSAITLTALGIFKSAGQLAKLYPPPPPLPPPLYFH